MPFPDTEHLIELSYSMIDEKPFYFEYCKEKCEENKCCIISNGGHFFVPVSDVIGKQLLDKDLDDELSSWIQTMRSTQFQDCHTLSLTSTEKLHSHGTVIKISGYRLAYDLNTSRRVRVSHVCNVEKCIVCGEEINKKEYVLHVQICADQQERE